MNEQAKIRIVIADDDQDFCFLQKTHLDLQPDMECCGVAHDGKAALHLIETLQPDVVLLDQVMPKLDGLGVLEYAKEHPFEKTPRFLISSANGQEHIMREMMGCGGDYFLEKPFDLETLVRRIRFVHRISTPHTASHQEETLTKVIAQKVLAIGVPTKLLGYDYIQEALHILITSTKVRPALKQVYTAIAERHDSDCRCVENAIASTVKSVMELNTPALQEVLALSPVPVNGTLSNGNFLTLVAQSIRLYGAS